MPNLKKIALVKELMEKLKKAKSLVLAQYQGLNTQQLESLKKGVEKADAKIIIAKNTLLALALKDQGINLPKSWFQGPTAVLLNFSPSLEALKSLMNFGRVAGAGLPKAKGGYFENQIYDQDQVTKLSELPAREVLLAKLLGLLKSPIQRLVTVFKSDQTKLVFVLKEVARLRPD